jgi:glyoxylase I family protein
VTEPTDTSAERRRLRISGLHHVTLISRDLEKTTAFYRDLLGLGLVQQGVNEDDDTARHFWFGDADGSAGTLVSFMEYPQMPDGTAGPGMGHHFALAVDSADELDGWHDYLQAQGVQTTDVYQRGRFRSLYLRDPDGHILELATRV